MKKSTPLLLLAMLFSLFLEAQNYYYPPLTGDQWDSRLPSELGWCDESIEGLYDYLEGRNTKGFIILKEGKIVLEKYFGDFDKDSFWYWASAGKSLAAFLTGMAQEEGLIDIEDPVSDYLGAGWTSTTPEQEEQITIRHQITMTSGLNDRLAPTTEIPDPSNCLEPECLQYLAEAGSRWAYHNAPYRLVQNVIEQASGRTFNSYTNTTLGNRIGMGGAWINYVRWGKARDLARFGHLILSQGVWKQDTLMRDQQYFYDMTHSSQTFNKSYGYLWWLAGQESYMLPSLQIVFNNNFVPNAPDDSFAALGKNDQKIYVVPSQDLVVVRIGDSAFDSAAAITSFDNELWGEINKLSCVTTSATTAPALSTIKLSPNPSPQILRVDGLPTDQETQIQIYDILGRLKWEGISQNQALYKIDLQQLPKGTYLLQLKSGSQIITRKIIKSEVSA
ncbi:MAG: serine hydrolase [Bacteroidota bacterium]